MSEVYILQNQDKRFLGKQRTWLDGRDPAALYRSPHKDEAVNEMFEASSKDYRQRVSLVSCPLSERRQPVIDPAILPPKTSNEGSLALTVATQSESTEADNPTQPPQA
jgi:hypothetical protein